MWTLQSNEKTFYLKSGKEISIGRNADMCEVVLADDTSISRKHASLIVSKNVSLIDHESKYGVFVNEGIEEKRKINSNKQITLSNGDRIRFGILRNVWKLDKMSFITCTSTLNVDAKSSLRSRLETFGGLVVDDWRSDCNFLTMQTITLTLKVVMALINNAHIVSLEYWEACTTAFNNSTTLPDPKKYVPDVRESTLNQETVDFLPNVQRKSILSSKKVIFFSRGQKQKYVSIIEGAGGSCFALSELKMTKSQLCSSDVIVVQYTSNNNTQESHIANLSNITSHIESKGRRLIPESEIGLAILYCSLEKYCNPAFDFTRKICGNTPTSKVTPLLIENRILAAETQESTKTDLSLTPTVVNATVDSGSYIGGKRKLERTTSDHKTDIKKRNVADADTEDIFTFIEQKSEIVSPASEKPMKLLQLAPVVNKRSRSEIENEDNLFDFDIPDLPSSPKRNKLSVVPSNETPKAKPVAPKPTSKKFIADETIPWLSKLNHSTTVKEEDEVDNRMDSNVTDKLESLNIGQTTITININLIKQKPLISTDSTHPKINFKKFKKVHPLRPQTDIIPQSEMAIYKPAAKQAAREILSEESSEEDLDIIQNKKLTYRSRKL